jgi:hypothetical protein
MSDMPDVIPNIVNPIIPGTDNKTIVVIRFKYKLSTTRASTSFEMTLQMLLVATATLMVAKLIAIPTTILITSVSSFV